MQFSVKRDVLLKSLNFVQGVVEKNTLPILSNVLIQLKDKQLSIVATDLDIIFYDEINDVKILKEEHHNFSSYTLRYFKKISSNSELNFELKSENKLVLKVIIQILIFFVFQQIIFLHSLMNLKDMKFR